MSNRRTLTIGGLLVGVGLGGFFDGIVLHQILQWHHLLSNTSRYPANTVAGLEANTLADGLFHAATWVATLVGVQMIWHATRDSRAAWSTRAFLGMLLAGWGLFNFVEGLVDHQILGLHHVNETAPKSQWPAWDYGFLLIGGVGFLVVGAVLARRPVAGTASGVGNRE